jgi:hypothetical protein
MQPLASTTARHERQHEVTTGDERFFNISSVSCADE